MPYRCRFKIWINKYQIRKYNKQSLNKPKALSAKVEEFKTRKEVIKAQSTSAEAQVKINESVTGISEEMHDVGVALNRG